MDSTGKKTRQIGGYIHRIIYKLQAQAAKTRNKKKKKKEKGGITERTRESDCRMTGGWKDELDWIKRKRERERERKKRKKNFLKKKNYEEEEEEKKKKENFPFWEVGTSNSIDTQK